MTPFNPSRSPLLAPRAAVTWAVASPGSSSAPSGPAQGTVASVRAAASSLGQPSDAQAVSQEGKRLGHRDAKSATPGVSAGVAAAASPGGARAEIADADPDAPGFEDLVSELYDLEGHRLDAITAESTAIALRFGEWYEAYRGMAAAVAKGRVVFTAQGQRLLEDAVKQLNAR